MGSVPCWSPCSACLIRSASATSKPSDSPSPASISGASAGSTGSSGFSGHLGMSSGSSGHSLLSIASANRLRATASSRVRFVRAPVSPTLPLLRRCGEDRGQIDSLRAVGVARAAMVAFVQREGGSSDDASEGNRNRERVDARGFQYQSGARPNHHAVDHRDHSGGRKCQLPCAGRRGLRRTRLGGDDEIRLELRREPQVKAAKERDPPGVGDVLGRALNQTQERHHAHERQHRQQDQGERIERRAEPGHLADEGKRDQVAGHGSEVDARASVGFGDGERAGGLEVEVLGGRERGRGSQAWTEAVREWRSARVASVVRSLRRAPRVSAAADGEPGRCVGSVHCEYLNGWRNASPALAPGTENTSRLSSRMSATTIWASPVSRSHSSETVSSASWRVSSSTNTTGSFLAQVEVAPVYERDLHGRAPQSARRLETAEAAADGGGGGGAHDAAPAAGWAVAISVSSALSASR